MDQLIIERLNLYVGGVCRCEPRVRLALAIGPVSEAPRPGPGGPDVDALTLADGQQCPVAVRPVTVSGRPARIDGAPSFSADSPAVEIVPTADPTKVLIRAAPLGSADVATATITVTADADLGAGVVTISTELAVTVV